ncbi:hypothetical protein A2755_03235 [Candidatus Wolfebacteria bacterium RIFCSPHIGHO2_01_FULL_48_22]|uniref:Uncharacterized protein n=2 Tax=Candidatus Wolfeibacteriota TaxID=1752735 RepID=A0A1F8DPK1_9BACT|nr:MAG: hypothetical protein A2755_03235 [Candidatus Wolfebacteria bacterium RIFCSPHIGHO2_01_FULL_48_22]OGM92043.1 MAG: hypothetical protein A2935_01725 [Candidatus Wolfebacteria bacterium RIFCSPLOWO2_01_FULL_47_17b]
MKKESESRKVRPRGLRRPDLGPTSFGYIFSAAIFLLILSFIFIPLLVNAQTTTDGLIRCGTPDDPNGVCGWDDLLDTLKRVMDFVLVYIAIPVAVIVVIIGGFQMIFSFGNEAKFASGRKMITSVAVGLAMTFGAWLIVKTLLAIFFNVSF